MYTPPFEMIISQKNPIINKKLQKIQRQLSRAASALMIKIIGQKLV